MVERYAWLSPDIYSCINERRRLVYLNVPSVFAPNELSVFENVKVYNVHWESNFLLHTLHRHIDFDDIIYILV